MCTCIMRLTKLIADYCTRCVCLLCVRTAGQQPTAVVTQTAAAWVHTVGPGGTMTEK